jgi:hypothetical protein
VQSLWLPRIRSCYCLQHEPIRQITCLAPSSWGSNVTLKLYAMRRTASTATTEFLAQGSDTYSYPAPVLLPGTIRRKGDGQPSTELFSFSQTCPETLLIDGRHLPQLWRCGKAILRLDVVQHAV